MQFTVIAETKNGEEYTDVMEAEDRFQIYRDLQDKGDRVISVTEVKQNPFKALLSLNNLFSHIKLDEKVMLARNLAAMLEAGLAVSRALDVMKRQTTNPRLKAALTDVITEVKKGGTLSNALSAARGAFPPVMMSMVKAGEESGNLTESLRVAAVQMERASTLEKRIKGALIYPAIVVIAMIVIAILMLIYVVPTLSATFAGLGATLPPTTVAIIAASNFLVHHPFISAGILIGLVVLVLWAMRTAAGKDALDWLSLHTPIIRNIVIETNAARTARTLASLFSAGVDMVLAVKITKDVLGSPRYKKVLDEAEAALTEGAPLSATFIKHPELYPPMLAEIVAVGEETGKLSILLKETAEFYEDSVERATKDFSTVIEPFMVLFIGAGVAVFAISMIGPIYSLSNSLG